MWARSLLPAPSDSECSKGCAPLSAGSCTARDQQGGGGGVASFGSIALSVGANFERTRADRLTAWGIARKTSANMALFQSPASRKAGVFDISLQIRTLRSRAAAGIDQKSSKANPQSEMPTNSSAQSEDFNAKNRPSLTTYAIIADTLS